MVVCHNYLTVLVERSSFNAADSDTAYELVVVYRRNEHLKRLVVISFRSRDVSEDSFKERSEVFARNVL